MLLPDDFPSPASTQVDLGVPVPLPPSPTLLQDISVPSSSDLAKPPLARRPTLVTVPAPDILFMNPQEPPRGRSRSRSPFSLRSYSFERRCYSDFARPLPSPTLPPIPAPPPIMVHPPRGRSRSRSPSSRRSYSPIYARRYSPPRSPSRSRSPSPCRCPRRRSSYRPRSITPSPERRYSFHAPPPPPIMFPPPPQPSIFVRPPTPLLTPPPMQPPIIIQGPSCMTPPPPVSPFPLQYEPVDIVTFNYNNDMSYAPAAKTYDEAIDSVLELWPELHSFDRDRISLRVGGSDQFVRVPKMAWHIVLGDLPRYEVIHVHVDQQPPPPRYQGDEKGKADGKWGGEDNKARRSKGFFSSIKRIFRC